MKGRPIQKSGRHAGKPYRKSQKAYAVDYGVSLPTVKRWWAKGLPCDDADAMGEHVSNRGRKPGESDDEFEAPSIVAPSGVPAPDDAETVDDSPAPVLLEETFYAGKGFLAEIERLKDAAQERRGAYFAAIRRRHGSLHIRNRLAEWMNVLEALRKVEKDLPGIRKANNQAVDKAELDVVIGQTFQAFRSQVNVAFLRLIDKLGLGDNPEAVAVAEKATERLLRTFADFSPPVANPEAEDTPAFAAPAPALDV